MPAIVFDLDGTLVDSAPDLHMAAVIMAGSLGIAEPTLKEVTSYIGNGIPMLVRRCLTAAGIAENDEILDQAVKVFMESYGRAPADLTVPYPGVADALTVLSGSGAPLGVCTNKAEAMATLVLEGTGLLPFFDVVIGGDRLAWRKPDPRPLTQAVSDLGGTVSESIYVGDSEVDAETAKAAGIRFALYSGGYRKTPVSELPHDFLFEKFADLPGFCLSDRS
ncbi:MAG: phosphoglycolate phosphatase [Alphaproteobacteria bacterium]